MLSYSWKPAAAKSTLYRQHQDLDLARMGRRVVPSEDYHISVGKSGAPPWNAAGSPDGFYEPPPFSSSSPSDHHHQPVSYFPTEYEPPPQQPQQHFEPYFAQPPPQPQPPRRVKRVEEVGKQQQLPAQPVPFVPEYDKQQLAQSPTDFFPDAKFLNREEGEAAGKGKGVAAAALPTKGGGVKPQVQGVVQGSKGSQAQAQPKASQIPSKPRPQHQQPPVLPKPKLKAKPSSKVTAGGVPFQEQKSGEETCGDRMGGNPTFLKILNEGLPKQGAVGRKNVFVVGAGIAGLTAAKLLKDAGHNVTIFEGTNRVGGRIQTYRSVDGPWMGEFGPMRIPSSQHFTKALIKRFNLPTSKFQSERSYSYLFLRGEKVERATVFKSPQGRQHFYRQYNIPPNETNKAPQDFMEVIFEEPVRDMLELDWRHFVKKYDRFSLRDFIQSKGISDQMTSLIGTSLNQESIFNIGFVEFVIDECLFQQDLQQIIGGFDLIPRSFLPELSENIIYNTKVAKVKYGQNGVTIKVSCRDITCPAALDPEYHGNYMIWTPTAGGTLSAEFEPLLPVEKNSALRTVYYETSVKVILAFQTPFWEKDHSERRGGHVFTDLPLQSLYYPSQKLGKNGKAVLLASYSWGGHARRLTGMPDDQVIEECLRHVAKIHNMSLKKIQELYHSGVVKKWSLDPFSLGAFVFSYPHHFTRTQDDLSKRVGPLMFAGEHTEFPHAWMDGAIRSGVRAAAELHLNADWTERRGVQYNKRPLRPRRVANALGVRMAAAERRRHHPNSLFVPEFTGW